MCREEVSHLTKCLVDHLKSALLKRHNFLKKSIKLKYDNFWPVSRYAKMDQKQPDFFPIINIERRSIYETNC